MTTFPDRRHINAAAANIAHALRGLPYALIGGAACQMLGSYRLTTDVDLVVPRGWIKAARAVLKANEYFKVQPRTLHTSFLSEPPVGIEILAPPFLFKEDFTATTPVIVIDSVAILKPSLILNAKCASILGRATDTKKTSDAEDIKFLLHWCMTNAVRLTTEELPNASGEFVDWFVITYGGSQLWLDAGFCGAGVTNSSLSSPSS